MKRLKLEAPPELKERLETIRDEQIQLFLGNTNKDIGQFVDSTATNLAGVRVVLKLIVRLLLILIRKEFKN